MNFLSYIIGGVIAVFGILFKIKDSQVKAAKKTNQELNNQLVNSEKKRVIQEVIIKKHDEAAASNNQDYSEIDKKEGDLINQVSEIQSQEVTEDEKKKEEINLSNIIYNNFNNSSRL